MDILAYILGKNAGAGGTAADITEVESKIGSLNDLTTTAKSDLVAAINEVDTSAVVTVVESSPTDYAKSYTLIQDDKTIVTINIPKDMVVTEGAVEVDPAGMDAGTYLVLTLANVSKDKIYINVGSLVDIYKEQEGATEVQIVVDNNNRIISASLVDGGVSKAKLTTDIQASLDKADSALQASNIKEGTTNGTIAVNGVDVAVHGLGTAAYTESSAYDAAGAANSAKTAVVGSATDAASASTIYGAKAYTDEAIKGIYWELEDDVLTMNS